MNAQGRVTLPASARRQLGLTEGARFEVAVDDNAITLRPAKVVLAEDAWAYTPENLAGIRRALADAKAGRVYRLSWDDLEKIGRTGVVPTTQRRQPGRTRTRKKRA
jgi:AbrB family looped-hinge helix DNA binding protein